MDVSVGFHTGRCFGPTFLEPMDSFEEELQKRRDD